MFKESPKPGMEMERLIYETGSDFRLKHRRWWQEVGAVIRFEPIEQRVRFRIQTETFNQLGAPDPIFNRAGGFHFIRPHFDFSRRSDDAMGQQPVANVFVSCRSLNDGFELFAGNAFETEEHIVQRTIVIICAGRSRHAGATFIYSTAGDGESGDAFARTMRGLFGQVAVNDGSSHFLIGWLS